MPQIYIKTVDWKSIFATTKLQAFTAGYQELFEFLNQTKVDQHGRIDPIAWDDWLIDLYYNDRKTYKSMQKRAKIITKQARDLGIKVQYNDVCRMNLRALA